jgi:sugar lactone lactonase YvrE
LGDRRFRRIRDKEWVAESFWKPREAFMTGRSLNRKSAFWYLLLLSAGCGQENGEDPPMEMQPMEALGPPFSLTITEVGLATPESALHDDESDVYLVANINGSAAEKDGNGFISRIGPDGEVRELKWVDGATPGVALDAPKGMAVVSDTLFVTDIDCIRRFHRVTGEPLQDLCLEEATFLNDLTATRRGDLYFSDSGTSGSPGAVYFLRQTADVPQKVALADGTLLEGEELGGPNGLFADRRGLYVTTFGSGEIFHVTPEGERLDMVGPSEMGLDGFVSLEERGFLFSSWGDQAVYWIQPGGTISALLEGVESPADIGYDARRNRVLVPLFLSDGLLVREVR